MNPDIVVLSGFDLFTNRNSIYCVLLFSQYYIWEPLILLHCHSLWFLACLITDDGENLLIGYSPLLLYLLRVLHVFLLNCWYLKLISRIFLTCSEYKSCIDFMCYRYFCILWLAFSFFWYLWRNKNSYS